MWITVKGYHRLRCYTLGLSAGNRLAVAEGISAARVLEILGVPGCQQADILLFVNGRPCALDRVLTAGDTLTLLERVAGG